MKLKVLSRLHDSFICAGGERGKATCRGDGGGPLFCRDPKSQEERYVQVVVLCFSDIQRVPDLLRAGNLNDKYDCVCVYVLYIGGHTIGPAEPKFGMEDHIYPLEVLR